MHDLATRLQRWIEAVYRIRGPVPVADYVIGRDQAEQMLGRDALEGQRELLLVRHQGDEVDLGLYIDADVFARSRRFLKELALKRHGPLDDFCVALEGVSHFVYYTYIASAHDRPVSQIELELQAELDKFLLLRLVRPIPGLVHQLFERFRLRSRLTSLEAERYTVASHRARRYALWIERKFQAGRRDEAIADARALYRKPFWEKLDHIEEKAPALARAA